MGNAATRSLERVGAAPIELQAGCDVAQGGVPPALPAPMATGLPRYTPEMYQLPNGFYPKRGGWERRSSAGGPISLCRATAPHFAQ